MTPARWEKVEELYHAACARDAELRPGFLDRACAGDTELRREVESLLRHESKAREFLESRSETTVESGELPGQIGPYRVSARLGAGGMGEVYRAYDNKLGRNVALKTLRRDFASNPESLARFRREARLLAALNHPNIAAIYGIEESNGTTYLVLELVEGQSLSGPLPVNQALEYARQVAEALEAAHAQGIIHRDLKPANVKVTPQSRVKVLDFGLAKALWGNDSKPDLPEQTGATVLETVASQIGGTPPYMSPEQACGGTVDQRTDIWAFGCLLYELLAGKRAFSGDTLPEAIEHVRWREPDWAALPANIPADVRELIRRCLQKDVALRVQSISEVRAVLERAQRKPSSWSAAIAICLSLVVLAVAALLASRLQDVPRSKGFQVKPLTSYPGAELFPAFSPDGRAIAFTWTGLQGVRTDLYTRAVDGEPTLRLTDDPALECYPAWSPDGALIAFLHCDGTMGGIRTAAEVYVVGASGGPKRRVGRVSLQAYDNENSVAWMPDGKHLVVRNRSRDEDPVGLFSLNIDTALTRQLTSPRVGFSDTSPTVSPDGRTLAFVRQTNARHGDIFVKDLSTQAAARQITDEQQRVFGVAWQSERELIYLAENGTARTLWRVKTDSSQREPVSGTGQIGMQFSVSQDGRRLVYSDAYIDANIARVSLSQAGVEKPLRGETIIASTQWDGSPQYSPDGRKIAFASARSGHFEIWVANSDGSNPSQLTFWNRYTGVPKWSPGGDEIVADSQEGKHTDIYAIGVDSRKTRKLTSGAGRNILPSWSRDGKWVYFVSDRLNGFQVWKAPAHPPDETRHAIQVTKQGGFAGSESFDGKRFYYAKRSGPSCVWSASTDGGQETAVICPLSSWHYIAMFPDGFYYVPDTNGQIWFFSLADQKERHVFDLQGGAGGVFAFTPDRKWLLISATELRGDLYFIDNLD